MGIDREHWIARTPGPTGLRARIEQVAELVEPVELPPPPVVEEPEGELDAAEPQAPDVVAGEHHAGSGILADVPHWRTNPTALASRLDHAGGADGEATPADDDRLSPA